MSSSTARSGVRSTWPLVRYDSPATRSSGRPCAISWIVKSNSLPATKSIARDACSACSRATATWAPTKPTRSAGLLSRSASATLTSWAKDGALVCSTARS
jgi:hypothetical protein